MLSSRVQAVCDGRSASCSFMAVWNSVQCPTFRWHQTCIAALMTRSLCSHVHCWPSACSHWLCALWVFSKITQADVIAAVKNLPDKQYTSNPLPTWLLKQSVRFLAPFLCQLFSCSLETQHSSVDVPSMRIPRHYWRKQSRLLQLHLCPRWHFGNFQNCLQFVLNATTRLICLGRRSEHNV